MSPKFSPTWCCHREENETTFVEVRAVSFFLVYLIHKYTHLLSNFSTVILFTTYMNITDVHIVTMSCK